MRKTPIKLRFTPFSHQVVAITRYTEKPNNLLVAHEKYDCTEDFEQVCAEYLAYLAEEGDNPVKAGEGHKYLLDGVVELVKRLKERNGVPISTLNRSDQGCE